MSLRDFMAERPSRRPAGCSICKHAERDAIEAAIHEWLALSDTERRNFGIRKLSDYVSTVVLDNAEGRWPARQTLGGHIRYCMETEA